MKNRHWIKPFDFFVFSSESLLSFLIILLIRIIFHGIPLRGAYGITEDI